MILPFTHALFSPAINTSFTNNILYIDKNFFLFCPNRKLWERKKHKPKTTGISYNDGNENLPR